MEIVREGIHIDEQINSDNFFKFVDYLYSPSPTYLYALQVLEKYPHMKMFCPGQPLDRKEGIIFVGMCTQVELCFDLMPEDGSYVVIQRDNERPFIESYYARKKKSVKHVYTIECQVNYPDVTALPHGVASIEGPNLSVEQVREEFVPPASRPIFCRLNTNKITHARSAAVAALKDNPLVDVIEEQLEPIEFFRQIKAHKYTMSLQSGGKDTTRTWETLALGRVPIISNCIELAPFSDMPVLYYPGEAGINEDWVQKIDLSRKSLTRATMSYWRNEILKMAHG